jgi:AcrR family transcriptional regulator
MKPARSARVVTDNRGAISTRAKLLTTAASLFRKKGYSATSTREIASALGIQNASLYYHIGGKEDLLFELSVESMKQLCERVEKAARDHTDIRERIRAMMHAHATACLEDQDKFATTILDFRMLSGARRKQIARQRKGLIELIRSVLREAHDQGVLREDFEPNHLALAWFNLVNWSIFWFSHRGELSAEQVADLVTAVFIQGTRRTSKGGRHEISVSE